MSFASADTVSVPSHIMWKSTSCDCARVDVSSRRACATTASLVWSAFASAAAASSASGTEPVRKYDRRDAISHDVSGIPIDDCLERSPTSGRNRNFGDSSIACTTFCRRAAYGVLPSPCASRTSSASCSSAVRGRRYARLPKSLRKGPTHAASPCSPASQPVSVVGSAVTVWAIDSAADSYCSMRTRLPVCELERLTNPSTFGSGTKTISGSV
jgi:hypothetical protein